MTLFEVVIKSVIEAAIIFYHYWWLFLPFVLWPLFELAWVTYVQEKFIRKIKWKLLEITIPKEIEKRPKTMEEIFSGLYSTNDTMIDTLYDVFLGGVIDVWFSYEIVSIGGDIHYFVRTPAESRHLFESQIYAQYSEAEIKEVEDYVLGAPDDIPSKEYDLWGTEMVLSMDDAYPIKTYKEFEEVASGEFIDPMSNIVEGVSKLKEGEQIWIQILTRATGDSWKEDANNIILDLIGREKKDKKPTGMLSLLMSELADIAKMVLTSFASSGPKKEEKKEKESPSMMLHLSPLEKDIVTAVGESTKKHGYETCIRWIYLAKRDVFDKGKGVSIVFTYFSQFGSAARNNMVPDSKTKTSAYYFFTDLRKAIRKRSVLRKYKRREFDKKGFVLNTEELATLYHFPTMEVKAPMVLRVEAKKGKPPSGLPT